ncbi:MAG: purine phosphoribosyltransferase family protein [Thermoplasmatales archaeon]|nr:purine phosphoribosyltransferase family protein [Thermoplasmatales archaeon]
MRLAMLKKSLKEAQIVKKEKYDYVIHPITDGIPEVKPELLEEVTFEMQKLLESCGQIDKLVTIEAMGIPLATALSLNMNIPFVIIRKRKYDLPDEISVEQKTGYSKSQLYINGLKRGDRIAIVDDVLSTGGTLKAVLTTLKTMGVIVRCVIIAVDKSNIAKKIMDETNVNIQSIINIEVANGKVIIKNV